MNIPIAVCKLLGKPGSDAGRRNVQRLRPMLLLLSVIPLVVYPLTLSDYLNKSTVTASADQFETITTNNEDEVQIIPNAELVVVKRIDNGDGGDLVVGDFSLTTNAGTLVFGAGVPSVVGDVMTYTSQTLYVAPGTYDLIEADVDGYLEGSWSCSEGTVGSDAFDAGEITLAFGEQTVCEITNDDIAPTLTLEKTLTNNNGGDLEIADFEISIGTNIVTSGFPNTVAANADLTISELEKPGYTAGTWECTDAAGLTAVADLPLAGAAGGATFQLEPGSDVTCAITNDDIAPSLTLVKSVTNDNGGDLEVADFEMFIDTTPATSGTSVLVMANQNIVIRETDVVSYAEGTWECIDVTGLTAGLPLTGVATGETIQLSPGADVTCSIVNNDLGIDLSIVKTVDDPTPNIGQVITFTLTVVNNGPDVATGASVSDIIPAGFTYEAGTISGGDTNDDTDPSGALLGWTLNTMPVGTPFVLTFDAKVNAP